MIEEKYCNGEESEGIEQLLESIHIEEDGKKLHGKKDDQDPNEPLDD